MDSNIWIPINFFRRKVGLHTIDISDLNSGNYIVSLIKDENIVDSKHFVK